jgi:hypothetical protein
MFEQAPTINAVSSTMRAPARRGTLSFMTASALLC